MPVIKLQVNCGLTQYYFIDKEKLNVPARYVEVI